MSAKDGGPAFPVPNDADLNGKEGVTVRQFYKSAALQGLASRLTWEQIGLMSEGVLGGMIVNKAAAVLADAAIAEDAEFAAKETP